MRNSQYFYPWGARLIEMRSWPEVLPPMMAGETLQETGEGSKVIAVRFVF